MVKDTVLKSGKFMKKKDVERSMVRMNTISDMLKSSIKLKDGKRFSRFNSYSKRDNSNQNNAFSEASPVPQKISDIKFNLSLEDNQDVSNGNEMKMYSSDEEENVKGNIGVTKPVYLNDDYTNSIIPERLEEEYNSDQGQIEDTESNKEKKSPLENKKYGKSPNQKLTPKEEMRKRIEKKISRSNSRRFEFNNSGKHLQSQINSKIKFKEPDFEQSYMPFNFSKTQKFLKTKGRNYAILKLTLFSINYQMFCVYMRLHFQGLNFINNSFN